MTLWLLQTRCFFRFRLNRVIAEKFMFPSCFPSEKGVWLGAESNRRHEDFQSSALPTELPSPRFKEDRRRKITLRCRAFTMQESGFRASASVALTLAWMRVPYNFK